MREEEDLKQRIISVIKEYDNQGIHRTGTEVDNQSAHWFANKIKKFGPEPRLEEFSLNRIDIIEAYIDIGAEKVNGVPLFDCTYPKEEIIGKLGSLKEKNIIGFTRVKNVKSQDLEKKRKNSSNVGIVVATQGLTPGLSLINAESFTKPFGPPTLQVSSENWTFLSSKIGTEVHLNIKVNSTPAIAYNVSARIEGKDPKLKPLVVMTPRSGWWNCASERAGGIAIFLEMIRTFTQSKPNRTVIFLANSGHELGHLGLNSYLANNSSLIKDASSWIHLGANLAENQLGLLAQSSDSDIESLGLKSLAKFDLFPSVKISQGTRPLGEAKNIFDGEGRFFSVIGTRNPLFHHPDDRWPNAINVNSTLQITKAMLRLASHLGS